MKHPPEIDAAVLEFALGWLLEYGDYEPKSAEAFTSEALKRYTERMAPLMRGRKWPGIFCIRNGRYSLTDYCWALIKGENREPEGCTSSTAASTGNSSHARA